MVIRAFKIVVGLILLVVLFAISQYYWGVWPGGLNDRRKRFNITSNGILERYYKDQKSYFEANKKFDARMHFREPYNRSETFHLGFVNDAELVLKACSNCQISNTAFRIAAYGEMSSYEGIWTIDENGKIERIPLK